MDKDAIRSVVRSTIKEHSSCLFRSIYYHIVNRGVDIPYPESEFDKLVDECTDTFMKYING